MSTVRARVLEERTLQALYDISVLAAAGRTEPSLVARVACEHAKELLGFEVAALHLWNEQAEQLDPQFATDARLGEPRRPGEGLVGEVYATGRPRAVPDYREYACRLPGLVTLGVGAALAVPLNLLGRTIGVLVVWSFSPREIEDREIQLLALFAAQVAPALGASTNFERTRRRRDDLESLHDFALQVAGEKDPARVAQLTAEFATGLLGGDHATVGWYDAETDQIVTLAAHRAEEVFTRSMPAGAGLRGAAFTTRRPVLVDEYAAWPGAQPEFVATGVASALAVPLVVRDRAVGTLLVAAYESGRFKPHHVEILSLLGALVGPDLEAAELLRRSEEQVRDLIALQSIAVAASGVRDPRVLGQLAVDTARDLLAVDSAVLRWYDPESRTLRLLAHNDERDGEHELELRLDRGVSGEAFASGQPAYLDDYQGAAQALDHSRTAGVRTALAVPLLVGDQPAGSLAVATYRAHTYDVRSRRLLVAFAALVGPALEASRLTEDRLASETQLRTAYDAMACGVVVWDGENRIRHINDTGLGLFGVTRDQFDGRPPSDIAGFERIHEDGAAMRSHERPMIRAFLTAKPVRSQVVGYRRPGQDDLWLQFDCIPVTDAEGRVRLVIGSFIDISPVKRAEAARLESEAKSRFLASMSHELRTPLNSILGFTQLLGSQTFGALSDRQRRYVGHIQTSGEHLLELVNDILDISRVAAGRMPFESQFIDLRELADLVVARVRPIAGSRTLTVRGGRSRATVRGDRRRVEQILHNLLTNAIKFTDPDGRIQVDLRPGRHEVVTAVHDNGIGIPAEHQERIFEEFTQVDDSRSRRTEGTGLGLALSRRLVEQMGGRLWVKSAPGAGSSFYFSIPTS